MTTLRLTFLGTSAAAPSATRNLSGLFVKREGDAFLFDCGEGTQRQMIRFGTGFGLRAIFFTHFHADHYLGVIGLLRTLSMHGIEEPLVLYGPPPASRLLGTALRLGAEDADLPVSVREIEPGLVLEGEGYRVEAFSTEHRISSFGYRLVESTRPGRFDPERARALGVPRGPLFGRLQRGEAVTLPNGREVAAESVVGPPRPGRTLVVSGDTRPCRATVDAARGADLLVHESTFGDREVERAKSTMHSTAREAAAVARNAGARRLVLTHLSTRYEHAERVLEREAGEVFPGAEIAHDGLELDLPLEP